MNKAEIIFRYQKGEAKKAIARELGINIKTVRKYCKQHDELIKELEEKSNDPLIIQEKILDKPRYNTASRGNYKYTAEIDARLIEILENEKKKDQILGKNHKQKLTNTKICEMIKSEGFNISSSTISNKIREKRDKVKECFIRQEYDLGDRLEFDFGEVRLEIGGKLRKYYMAVLSSPAADFRWAYLYNNQKKDVFLDAHVRFFERMQGVYREVVYDNMKNVVAKFLGKNEKVLNQDLINLSIYYGFDINVTNAFKGNEKGHVEGSVKIIRSELFGPVYQFESIEQAREYLNHGLSKLNANTRIEEEKKKLLAYRPMLDLAEVRLVSINKYSFARIMNNNYSLPDYLVGKKIIAKIYHDKIRFYSNTHFVCEHKKIDGAHQTSIDIRHYLRTFKSKPGALNNSLALKNMTGLKSIYDIYFKGKPKKFIELLEKYQDLSGEDLENAVKNSALLGEKLESDPSIEVITNKQLSLYNRLSIGRLQ